MSSLDARDRRGADAEAVVSRCTATRVPARLAGFDRVRMMQSEAKAKEEAWAVGGIAFACAAIERGCTWGGNGRSMITQRAGAHLLQIQ